MKDIDEHYVPTQAMPYTMMSPEELRRFNALFAEDRNAAFEYADSLYLENRIGMEEYMQAYEQASENPLPTVLGNTLTGITSSPIYGLAVNVQRMLEGGTIRMGEEYTLHGIREMAGRNAVTNAINKSYKDWPEFVTAPLDWIGGKLGGGIKGNDIIAGVINNAPQNVARNALTAAISIAGSPLAGKLYSAIAMGGGSDYQTAIQEMYQSGEFNDMIALYSAESGANEFVQELIDAEIFLAQIPFVGKVIAGVGNEMLQEGADPWIAYGFDQLESAMLGRGYSRNDLDAARLVVDGKAGSVE